MTLNVIQKMPEREDMVGATHDFHDEEYAHLWAESFRVTKERLECFEHIGDLLQSKLDGWSVILELGTGPGYLASYLLQRFKDISYHCVDYSDAMLNIAKENLEEYSSRVTFQQIDLLEESWEKKIENKPVAIVSTWALHDLDNEEKIAEVYQSARKILLNNGILLNADFIKPEGIQDVFENGRFPIINHQEYLKNAGFSIVECTKMFEINLVEPASHNNYACFKGLV